MPDLKLLKGSFLQDQAEVQKISSSRRRSCALVNTPTTCVNKAVCHIQELMTKLENWGQQGDNAQHETANENNQNIIWKCVSIDGKTAVEKTELCIDGMGLCIQEREVLTSLWTETTDVLMEVRSLMERLEWDLREAEKALEEEKERAKKLLEKQDSLYLWKQKESPIAMQKELEACSTDIAELTLHVKMRRDQLPLLRDQLTHTEVLNRRLKEDIDFMRKHGPLAYERLQLESEIMKQIQTAQNEASETFTSISHKLKLLQQEFNEEKFRADFEGEQINKELEMISNQLLDKQSVLQQLQSQHELLHRRTKEYEGEVALKDGQIKDLLQEICQFERQDADINDAVMTVKAKLEDKEEIFMKKKKEIIQVQNQIQKVKCENDEKASAFDAILSQKRRDLSALREENEDHKFEIEDYKNKICQSEQAVRQLKQDHEHLLQKIRLNEEQGKQAKAELDQVSAYHTSTKDKLDVLEQQTFLKELRNRKQTESLKIQIMAEMQALAILKGNVAAITAEYNCEQTRCEKVKGELQKKNEDAFSKSAQLQTEVEQLRQLYTEKSETIENLKAKLSDMQYAHRSLTDNFEQKKKSHQEYLISVKETLHVVLLRYEEISNRIKEFSLKSKEFKQVSDTMEQSIRTLPDIVEELQSMSDAIDFKLGTATVVMGHLNRDITSCEQRKSRWTQIQSALLTQRQTVMTDTEVNLQKALKENQELAQEYRVLQKELMIARQEAICVFEKRNRTEAYFQDHKQLSLLQKRMHKAMLKYFKHRSVYSQAELAHFQALSNQNIQKMKALQEELSNAIHRLSEFLLALTDDSTISHVPQQPNRPVADAVGSCRKMPTVQIVE
ncbi:coiled-coil domain-containing protein 178 [Xyrauchen texanus]|uniref:coiled-coil domain-containing protein 178 n=1 Tax=Xyrauchen texanus TaxID=154827 RepID=UPI002241EAEE|nr:coiled-coil domain-containing protein 178 [Xyrauchen texanus]